MENLGRLSLTPPSWREGVPRTQACSSSFHTGRCEQFLPSVSLMFSATLRSTSHFPGFHCEAIPICQDVSIAKNLAHLDAQLYAKQSSHFSRVPRASLVLVRAHVHGACTSTIAPTIGRFGGKCQSPPQQAGGRFSSCRQCGRMGRLGRRRGIVRPSITPRIEQQNVIQRCTLPAVCW